MDLLGFLIILASGVVVGFVGDAFLPGQGPFTWLASMVVGLIGGLIGTALLGGLGPEVNGVYPLPVILGAIVFVVLLELTLSAFVVKPSSD